MKRILSTAVLLLLLSIAYSQTDCNKKNVATVEQYSGLYVFAFSKPVNEIEHIATIRKTFIAETTLEFMQKAAAYTKSKYPDATAIIFHDVQNGFSKDTWDVVRFKN